MVDQFTPTEAMIEIKRRVDTRFPSLDTSVRYYGPGIPSNHVTTLCGDGAVVGWCVGWENRAPMLSGVATALTEAVRDIYNDVLEHTRWT